MARDSAWPFGVSLVRMGDGGQALRSCTHQGDGQSQTVSHHSQVDSGWRLSIRCSSTACDTTRRLCSGCSRSPWTTDLTVSTRKPTFDLQRRCRASDRCQCAADITRYVRIARTWNDRWSWLIESEGAVIRTPQSRSTSMQYALSLSTCGHGQTRHVPRRSCSSPQAWPSTKRSVPS